MANNNSLNGWASWLTPSVLTGYGLQEADLRYLKDIINTKISMFTYEGLPDDLTPQILETALMFRNHLCFYFSKGLQKWLLGYYIPMGEFDYYYKPVNCTVMSFKGVTLGIDVPYKELILVRDNTMDIIPFVCCAEYIDHVKKIENTLGQQLNILSLPIVLLCNDKTKTQMQYLARKAGVNDPFVLGDKTLAGAAQSFKVDVPISPLDIYDLKQKYKNECLQSLGIYSVEEKRERMLSQEVTTQNDFTDFIYQGEKQERQKFIDELNKASDGKINAKLIELYMLNLNDTAKEEEKTNKAQAKGQAEGALEGNPNAGKEKDNTNVN